MSVAAIEIDSGARRCIPVDAHPHGLDVTLNGSIAYVGSLESRLYKIDLIGANVEDVREFPDAALADVLLSSDGRACFLADFDHDLLLVLDPESLDVLQEVSVPSGPTCLSFDPILRRIYCSCQNDRSLAIVSFTSTSSYDEQPIVTSQATPGRALPVGVDVSPNAERVFVCLREPAGLAVYHVDSQTWYTAVPVDEEPTGVCATPDSRSVAMTAGRDLLLFSTRYGFGTAPAESGEA